MTGPIDPSDPGTGSADSPPGGGRGPGYRWIIGLVAVAVLLTVVSAVIGGTEGAPPPSR